MMMMMMMMMMMYELKKNGKIFTNKFVRTRPSSYEKRIYRVAVSQRLRNTDLYYEVSVSTLAAIYLQRPQDQYSICSLICFRRNVDISFSSAIRSLVKRLYPD